MSATRTTWYEEARRELVAEKKRATRAENRAAQLERERDQLKRRLTGALYELYRDWGRVNRELGRG